MNDFPKQLIFILLIEVNYTSEAEGCLDLIMGSSYIFL